MMMKILCGRLSHSIAVRGAEGFELLPRIALAMATIAIVIAIAMLGKMMKKMMMMIIMMMRMMIRMMMMMMMMIVCTFRKAWLTSGS